MSEPGERVLARRVLIQWSFQANGLMFSGGETPVDPAILEDEPSEGTARYGRFLRQHEALYQGVRSLAPVCLVVPWQWDQVQADPDHAHHVLTALLWFGGRMADAIHVQDTRSEALGRYRLLVLYGLETVDDVTLQIIRGYVMKGGHVIAIGPIGRYDPQGRERPADANSDLFGPRHTGQTWDTVQARLAEGRVTSFPTLDIEQLSSQAPVRHQFWREVDQLAGPRPLAHDGQGRLVGNLVRQDRPPRLVLYLINLGEQPIACVHVAVAAQGLAPGRLSIASPDPRPAVLAEPTLVAGGAHFQVHDLDLYAVVVMEQNERDAGRQP